jgi:hypothetical protein
MAHVLVYNEILDFSFATTEITEIREISAKFRRNFEPLHHRPDH